MKSLFIITFFLFCSTVSAQKVLNISTGEYPPYTGKNLYKGGAVLHMVEEAFKAMGYKVKYHFLPWRRGYQDSADGMYDASAFYVCTKERQADHYCSENPVIRDEFVLFYNKNKRPPVWNELSDLKNENIGLTLGYFYIDQFISLAKKSKNNITTEIVKSDKQNFKKLLSGNITAFPCDRGVGQHILRNHFSKEQSSLIKHIDKVIFSETAHILFSKKSKMGKKYRDIFDRGMSVIINNGIKKRIVADSILGLYD